MLSRASPDKVLLDPDSEAVSIYFRGFQSKTPSCKASSLNILKDILSAARKNPIDAW